MMVDLRPDRVFKPVRSGDLARDGLSNLFL